MSLEDKLARVEKKIIETEEKVAQAEAEGNQKKWEILMNDLARQRGYLEELQKEKNLLLQVTFIRLFSFISPRFSLSLSLS